MQLLNALPEHIVLCLSLISVKHHLLFVSQSESEQSGNMNLGGSITRQSEADKELSSSDFGHAHVKNIGEMVEEMETKCRLALNDIYFGKTKDLTNQIRLHILTKLPTCAMVF